MLTRLALFNSAAIFLDQLAVILISLFLSPLIISVVGVSAFAVWQLILRGSRYVSLTDGRSHEMLKWQVSRAVNETDNDRRQHVGASLVVWISYLPFMILCCVALVIWADTFQAESGIESQALLLTAILMALNAIFMAVVAFPEAVLRGSNKGYKQIGLRAGTVILAGISSYQVLKAGYGLPGLATVQVISTLVLAILYLRAVRKNVSWWGIRRPTRPQVKYAYRRGFWYFAASLVNFGFASIDILLLGFFASTIEVARFAVTYYVIQMIIVALSTALSAVLPGLGSLLGKGENDKAARIRREGILYTWWFAITISITVLLINESFVSLWIKEDIYAGYIENIMIILMALQMVFLRNDALIINLVLEQKEKVKVTLYSLVVIVVLSALLIPEYGIIGLCVAIILGRLVVNYFYPRIIARYFGQKQDGVFKVVSVRGWFVTLLLFSAGLYLNQHLVLQSWLSLIFTSAGIFIVMLCLLYFLGFNNEQKMMLKRRVSALR